LTQTGQGILNDAELISDQKEKDLKLTSIQTAVLGICKQFYILDPVMKDRASSRPVLTNEEKIHTKQS
jgi:hypothetical protein